MVEKTSLAGAIHRLATDEELRRRLLIAPRQVLMAELGISGETYEALVSLIPIVVAGGLFVLSGGAPTGANGPDSPGWGGWGK
jgi:hypothetical protein